MGSVSELVELGVAGFKIEGRLKSADYVAAATRAYRDAMDAAFAGAKAPRGGEAELRMAQSFSRGSVSGRCHNRQRAEGIDERAHGRLWPRRRCPASCAR
jgi:putative protease